MTLQQQLSGGEKAPGVAGRFASWLWTPPPVPPPLQLQGRPHSAYTRAGLPPCPCPCPALPACCDLRLSVPSAVGPGCAGSGGGDPGSEGSMPGREPGSGQPPRSSALRARSRVGRPYLPSPLLPPKRKSTVTFPQVATLRLLQ